MKRLIYFLLLSVLSFPATAPAQTFNQYCSTPPYASRAIIPNIMILMDNSADMLTSAYSDTYAPNADKDNYIGYFKPEACYEYTGNVFREKLQSAGPPAVSYSASDTCPSTAPFRGNLLNWATMSKYDLLQKIIVGGNAVSKQGNAHTLVSISGSWTKTYNGCEFVVTSGNLYVTESTTNACGLLDGTAIAFRERPAVKMVLAWLSRNYERLVQAFSGAKRAVTAAASWVWEKVELIRNAYAAQLVITPQTSWSGTVGTLYSFTLEVSGANNAAFTWTFNPSPPASWFTDEINGDQIGDNDGICESGEACSPTYSSHGNKTDYRVTFTGMPMSAGTYTVTAQVSASGHATATGTYTITITEAPLQINTASLPAAEKSQTYSYTMLAQGGTPFFDSNEQPYYHWSASGLPGGITIDTNTGVLSTSSVTGSTGNYSVTITATAASGATVSRTFTLAVGDRASLGRDQASFNVKVVLTEDPLTDLNGNGIWDSGEDYTDSNGNGVWDGKGGVFQQFWDANNPRARWGLAKFRVNGSVVNADYSNVYLDVDACVPASPASSFYTRIQNATPVPVNGSPLNKGLYGLINYFANSVGTGYTGCTNSDPMDIPCRKNFVLMITSGSDIGGPGTFASYPADCTSTTNLVKNACYGYKSDLRPATVNEKERVSLFVVNTMGTNAANNQILKEAAIAGGGASQYYEATDTSTLQARLVKAIQDILAQAASGTAVSVLSTSSRGVGSVVQAYFLPSKQEGTRDVEWIGFLQNIWIDPLDNLRDDSSGVSPAQADYKLEMDKDDVMRLYFNQTSSETEAALFTTTADGTGGTLASCPQNPPRVQFSRATTLWEAGLKLAMRSDSRNIFTAKKVLRNTATGPTISLATTDIPSNDFDNAMTAGNSLYDALNSEPTTSFTAENIVRYIRGDCIETTDYDGGTGACGSDAGATFRDRRVDVDPSSDATDYRVWKLGDIINSTPKVLSTVPQNTYHVDYGDVTYYSYASTSDYKNRSSVAFVGANDGMLHAFRVGYLKDTGLLGSVKAFFHGLFSADGENPTNTDKLGEEMWAYVPFNAFPYLKYFANTAYCHIYYTDLSVRLIEASVGSPTDGSFDAGDDRTASSWRTILLGGMRFGGACAGGDANPASPLANTGFSSYFAIDVTDVGATSDPASEPVPLWEFSDVDMGYTSSFPAVVRTGELSKNGNWYVVLGSGSKRLPKDGQDMKRTTNGYVYFLNLKTGELKKKIELDHPAIVGDILSVDANKNYHSERIYFGTSYCTSYGAGASDSCNSAEGWQGKLMRINIPPDLSDDTASSWSPVMKTLFSGNYPFTASPDAAKDESGKVWVYAGSGKFYSNMDEEDASQHIFTGFKDQNDLDADPLVSLASSATGTESCPASCPADTLCNVTNCSTTGTVGSTVQVCDYDKSTNMFGWANIVTSITNASSSPKSDIGWVLFLEKAGTTSEKMITRPLAVGGLVDFLTYKPTGSICSYGGESYLYSVDYTSGVAPTNIAIRAAGATSGAAGDITVNKRILLGPGAPPTGEAIIIAPPKEGQDKLKKKIQIATGVIVEAENKPTISTASKIMQWLRK